ncbi:hypothetical protein RvY_02155 [Ramazzottius varieornatus]|uniref:Peptidase M12A domain-containing protein n=1 Tax=Ramazzottius varieornatus TaxID=947166 RepID=A0A1D1UMI3_RAMVA|nr:hypothetical protein RvY_02155 [Ramazzottius varieornatus]
MDHFRMGRLYYTCRVNFRDNLVSGLFLLVCLTSGMATAGAESIWVTDTDQYSQLGRLNLNTDPRYLRWPDPSYVPYKISSDYTPAEERIIHDSMDQIFYDTLGCVRFALYNSTSDKGKDYVEINPAVDGTCWSYPGLLPSNGDGQKLGISSGKYGCTHSKRLVMKTLFHVLGKRSEHNRPDRDDYLDMHLENLDPTFAPFAPFQKYLDSTVYYQGFPYDYNSITHHLPTAYAKPGSTVFSVRDSSKTIGDKPRLSYWDCYAMSMQYQCQDILKNDRCRNVDAYRPTVTVLAGVTSGRNSSYFSSWENETPPATITSTTSTTATTTTATPPTLWTRPAPESVVPVVDPQLNQIPNAGAADYMDSQTRKTEMLRNICEPGFRVDAAVQSQDQRILIFSGNDYYIITTAGFIKAGPLPIARDFPDIPKLPITAAFSTQDGRQKITHLISDQNDYSYVDLSFIDYLPIVEDDLLTPILRTVFTIPDPNRPQTTYEYRLFNGQSAQYVQIGSDGKKVPLSKSQFLRGNASMVPSFIDSVVIFRVGSLSNSRNVALVFSADHVYLMDVDYSCLSSIRAPCLAVSNRGVSPIPLRNVLACQRYAVGRSFSPAYSAGR